jgi:hypothetical protein
MIFKRTLAYYSPILVTVSVVPKARITPIHSLKSTLVHVRINKASAVGAVSWRVRFSLIPISPLNGCTGNPLFKPFLGWIVWEHVAIPTHAKPESMPIVFD